MEYNIAYIPGDGIGTEIIAETIKVIKEVGSLFNHSFIFNECIAGTKAVELCKKSDSILLGNMWMDMYPELAREKRPSYLLALLRKNLNLTINIRPIVAYEELADLSPLKSEIINDGFDILVVRDVAAGMLMSNKYQRVGEFGREACDEEYYNEVAIKANLKCAFEAASNRNKKVTSLDKAVILESSKLWRKVAGEISEEYPDVDLVNQHIDDAAGIIIGNPKKYDVIVTNGIFGDILSDEISGLSGTPKMLASAEISGSGKGLYTPNQLHNSERDIVGKNIANPIGSILSGAMMLRYSFKLEKEACIIEEAVKEIINEKYTTKDIYMYDSTLVGTDEMGTLICNKIRELKGVLK